MKKSSLRTYVKGWRQGGCNLFCWQFMVKTVNCQQFNEQSLSSASPPPLPQKVERGRIPSPPPVPTSFALRASTMTLIELGSITKNKHPVSFILKLDKPEIQHFVPVATRVFFLGKQTVPTLGPSCTGLTSLINAISFLRWDMEKPACMIILLTRYTTPSPWIWCAPIEWIKIRNKTEWMIWMLCVQHLGYNLATVFYGPVIYSVPLMLMSLGAWLH